jgi:hypothetical protein
VILTLSLDVGTVDIHGAPVRMDADPRHDEQLAIVDGLLQASVPGATPLWRVRRLHVGSGSEALVRSMLIDMSRTLEQIEDEVLRLPEESRVRLMERLLSSFQEQAGSEEEGIARAWVEEAERRDDEMSSGREEGLPAQEVISKLRSSRR